MEKCNCNWYSEEKNECRVLNLLKCRNKNCSFYETKEQYDKRQKKFEEKYNMKGGRI